MVLVLRYTARVVIIGLLLLTCAACDFDAPENSELTERTEIAKQVSMLLKSERFDELDALAETYRSTKARTSSGLWKLSFFYSGFDQVFPRSYEPPSIWEALSRPAAKWIAHNPNSPTARLVYVTMLMNQAWGIRGTGHADTVDEQQWEPFFAKVEEAKRYLEESKAIASVDPYWYRVMVEIATLQDWAESDAAALLSEALDREPLYYDTYFEATNRDLPKWGGDAEKVEALARDAVQRTQAAEGAGLYARIYWSASGSQFGDSLFEESNVDWAEMKRGIDDVLSKYPDDWNLNYFAKFACLAGDYAKAADLIDHIKGKPLPMVWGPYWYLERCRMWAMIASPT